MSPQPKPLVSVVVATHNMGKYLRSAVDSILAQTHQPVQVCLVDDGSEDDTPAITAVLARDPRIVCVRQENGGQANAKNRGIREATGEYVAFLDADDLWLPEKLERQLPLFERNCDVAVVYSEYDCMDGKDDPIYKIPTQMHRGRVSARLMIENFICFPTAVVRHTVLRGVGGFDESLRMGIDYDLWLRISATHEFDYLQEPTVRYRVWEGQMSRNFRLRYATAERIMQRFLDEHPGLVTPSVVAEAWAHTWVGRGNTALAQETNRAEARRDFCRALRHKPTYTPAWKSLMRSFF